MPTPPNSSTAADLESSELTLLERYHVLMDRVAAAAERSGRTAKDIIVVLVSKYGTLEQIRELVGAGHLHFGESRAQQLEQRAAQISEWLGRMREVSPSDSSSLPEQVHWHMIGHLQRNKAKKTIQCSRLIQTVDSLRLAEEIQAAAAKGDRPVEVLIQVNVTGEPQKKGIAPPAVRHLIDQVETMVNVQVRGLMCMGENTDDASTIRRHFEHCQELFEEITLKNDLAGRFNILSMGMSNDYEVAIECGSNCIRVGSAVFQDEGKSRDA
ncbi:MAG: YggS family pyridoxal phosphate enzyme [Planctomycetes bacterium TMED75]|nr:YggS family pyridoxal phosphate-dependent enzyme [Planctomycetaceae bacterium]OUU91688.1 MAG: YggS family pyridoxal phosphate enzyme [Planctomycetes bacterium TMED75]